MALDLDPDDELWWVRAWLKREQLEVPPPEALAVRRAAEDLYANLAEVPTERKLVALVEELNRRILEVNRKPGVGPPTTQGLLDVERVRARWAEARSHLGR